MLGLGNHQSQIHIMNPQRANWHHREESTATLLMEKSPISTQRSKVNLNAIMDAYNNLNKHPSVFFDLEGGDEV